MTAAEKRGRMTEAAKLTAEHDKERENWKEIQLQHDRVEDQLRAELEEAKRFTQAYHQDALRLEAERNVARADNEALTKRLIEAERARDLLATDLSQVSYAAILVQRKISSLSHADRISDAAAAELTELARISKYEGTALLRDWPPGSRPMCKPALLASGSSTGKARACAHPGCGRPEPVHFRGHPTGGLGHAFVEPAAPEPAPALATEDCDTCIGPGNLCEEHEDDADEPTHHTDCRSRHGKTCDCNGGCEHPSVIAPASAPMCSEPQWCGFVYRDGTPEQNAYREAGYPVHHGGYCSEECMARGAAPASAQGTMGPTPDEVLAAKWPPQLVTRAEFEALDKRLEALEAWSIQMGPPHVEPPQPAPVMRHAFVYEGATGTCWHRIVINDETSTRITWCGQPRSAAIHGEGK